MKAARRRVAVLGLGLALGLLIAGVAVLFGLAVGAAMLRLVGLVSMGAAFAYVLSPLAKLFERKLSRGLSAGASLACVVLALGLVFALGVPSFIRQLALLVEAAPQYRETISHLLHSIEEKMAETGMSGAFASTFSDQANVLMEKLIAAAGGWAVSLPSFIVSAAMVCLMGFYFLKDRAYFFDRLAMLVPSGHRAAALDMACAIRGVLRGYVRGALTVSVLTGALTGAACAVLGLPGYLVLGALMAVFDLIPYIGPFIGAAPILVIAAGFGWGRLLAALAVVVAIQEFEALVLSPRIIGERSGLHPVIVVLAVFLGGELLGVAGMLFSVPAALSVVAAGRSILHRRLYSKGTSEIP